MKVLAIDYGDKNIGIAITDETATIAIPHSVEKNNREFSKKLLKLIRDKKITKVIAGIPFNLKGQEGEQAKKTKNYFNKLSKSIGMDIEFVDERFTTKDSENRLRKLKKPESIDIDKYAAAIILENYLKKNS